MSTHETLGLLLVREGLITRPELYDALRLQRQNNRLLGTCLLELGYVRPDALLTMLSKQLGIPALPPGTLNQAHPEALRRVPRELAFRLRVLPYSWDGQLLGVALADGRVLEHLREVAYVAQAAVGAYVALEIEIELALQRLYAMEPATPQQELPGRPRPVRAETPVSAQELGPAVLKTVKSRPPPDPRRTAVVSAVAEVLGAPPAKQGPPPAAHRPPPAAATMAATATAKPSPPQAPVASPAMPAARPPRVFTRLGFFDAIEQIYNAPDLDGLAELVGRALLNYFSRALVGLAGGGELRVLGTSGLAPKHAAIPLASLPQLGARLGERAMAYGVAAGEPRAQELAAACGVPVGATALLATVPAGKDRHLLVWGDNADLAELYEDLHDVELLFKEAETGLHMLLERR